MTIHREKNDLATRGICALMVLLGSVLMTNKSGAAEQPNVILILADDLGIDHVGFYGVHQDRRPSRTPNLDRLASDWVAFDWAYAFPVCSPTRASILTGRGPITGIENGEHHGVTAALKAADLGTPDEWSLPLDLITLPDVLRPAGYTSVLIGKWHLGQTTGENWRTDRFWDPLLAGFDALRTGSKGGISTYYGPAEYEAYGWGNVFFATHDPNGVHREEYSLSRKIDSAVEFVNAMQNEDLPYFLWLSLHSPHRPYTVPPVHLHRVANPTTRLEKYHAMVEAMDQEIARFLEKVDLSRTTVIFMGDNGTPTAVALDPDEAKASLADGGIHVPLLVAGHSVADGLRGRRISAPVISHDLFATVAEITGAELPAGHQIDGRSFLPLLKTRNAPPTRTEFVVSRVRPNGLRGNYDRVRLAAQNADGFKVHWDVLTGEIEFFDVHGAAYGTDGDPLCNTNCPDGLPLGQRAQFDRLIELLEQEESKIPNSPGTP